MIIKIKKDGKIQKYYFNKADILTLLIILIIGIIIFLMLYITKFNVKSITPDGAAHFLGARTFAVNESLNMNSIVEKQFNFDGFQFFGIVNLGMLFKCFPNLNSISQYKIYAIYNIFLLMLSGLSFYLLLKNRYKNKKNYIISMFITVLYLLGYPLVSLTYGFFYWGLAGTIVNIIILMCNMYTKKEYNKNLIVGLISLLTLGLFCCYYIFVPIVYLSMFIFIIYYYKREKEINKKDMIKFIIITLIIPFIIGFLYFLLRMFINPTSIKTASTSQGGNYKNLISNFILIIPFIFHGYSLIKKDNKNIIPLMFLTIIMFVFICFCLMFFNLLSSYYFYKLYYLLWMVSWTLVYYSFINLLKDHKIITYGMILTYATMFVIMISGIDERLERQIDDIGNLSPYKGVLDIYDDNHYTLKEDNSVLLDSYEMEGIKYIINNKEKLVNENNEIAVIGSYWQRRWFESLTDIIPKVNYNGNILEYYNGLTLSEWETLNTKYIVVFNYKLLSENNDKYELYDNIYKNKSMAILVKN